MDAHKIRRMCFQFLPNRTAAARSLQSIVIFTNKRNLCRKSMGLSPFAKVCVLSGGVISMLAIVPSLKATLKAI